LAAYDSKQPCPVEALSHSIGCSESFTEQLMLELRMAALVIKGT
jgi:DNA-binding IscR family transcriptional regulator